MYKRTFYQLTTKKYCAGISKDQDGYVYIHDTAPCYKWAAKKNMKFSDLINYYKRKGWLISCTKIGIDVDVF